MGCAIGCLKCLLIMFNVIFGLIGLLLLVIGAVVLATSGTLIQPLIETTLSSIPGLTDLFNLQDGQAAPDDLNLNVEELLSSVAICFIVLGIFLIITCIFGSCGACCNNRCMLYVYAAIVIALFLVQLILVILFFTGALDKTIKKQMKKTIDNDFGGIDHFDVYSLAWNVMMIELKCCGVNNYTDFNDAVKWDKQRAVAGGSVDLVTPMACCKFTTNQEPINTACAIEPTDAWSNWKAGCWDNMWVAMESFEKIVIGVLAAALVFQALCGIAAIIIGVQITKDEGAVA